MKENKWVGYMLLAISILFSLGACSKKDGTVPDSEMLKIQDSMMEKFRTTELSSDPDDDFSTLAMIYNETAIALAQKELAVGKNQRMRRVAEEVIAERTQEIKEIQKLITSHIVHLTVPEIKKLIQLNVERTAKNADLQAITGNIDKDFAAVMIYHNQGLIENVSLQLAYGSLESLKSFGKDIAEKRDQQTRYLQAWLIGNRNPD